MPEAYLKEHAAQMGFPLSEEQLTAFGTFHRMLYETNKVMNLTRVSEEIPECCDRNYLDSLGPAVTGLLANRAQRVVDVGAGAGFPGVPLAIALPEAEFVFADALKKRIDFLNGVIAATGIRASAVHARAEDLAKTNRDSFDVCVSRAVANLGVLAELCLPLVKTGGLMLALKGPDWENELNGAKNALRQLNGRFVKAVPYDIPGRDWQHTVVVIEKTAPTPPRFPRRAGLASEKPL